MNNKQLRTYLLCAFLPAWALQVLASHFALQGKAQIFQLIMIAVMFVPLIAALLAGVPLKDLGWKPELRKNKGALAAAWLGPALLGTLGAALYYLVLPARLDLSGAYLKAQVGESGMEQLAQAGLDLKTYFLVQAAAALTYAPFLNTIPALGEEIGWRGALYPALKARLGSAKGRLLGGVIWGAWHWPVMVLAGYEYGLHYFGAPVLGPLIFCLFTVSAGVFLDHLYEKSRCIWFPALGHGAINAFAALPCLLLNPAFADQQILGPTMVGVLSGLPLLLLALWLLRKDK